MNLQKQRSGCKGRQRPGCCLTAWIATINSVRQRMGGQEDERARRAVCLRTGRLETGSRRVWICGNRATTCF